MEELRQGRCILFDWGDTLMRDFTEFEGPMVSWPKVEAMPYAGQVLAELHDQAILAVATNADVSTEADIRAALERVDLGRFLDRIYCVRGVGYRKPSKEFFEHILTDLGIDRSQVIMVGDYLEVDVLGANACGIRGVWYNHRRQEKREGEMFRTILDLRDLPGAIKKLMTEE